MSHPAQVEGPWTFRHVAANGARFHVAEIDPGGDAPLVLLLHGFPQFWWSWRHQLPLLAEHGYRAVAMDLRGYGGSDKTPDGYDPVTLAADVVGVLKALGEPRAVLVGQGWGGYVAWTAATRSPEHVRALCAVSAPHPLHMLQHLRRGTGSAIRHVLAMQVPLVPERRLSRPGSRLLARHLEHWSAPGSSFPDEESLRRYGEALALWPAPHCALEYHRWLFRSRLRSDGRAYARLMSTSVPAPVLCMVGAEDPSLPPPSTDRSADHVDGPFRRVVIEGCGHFVPEEHPAETSAELLDWLGSLPA